MNNKTCETGNNQSLGYAQDFKLSGFGDWPVEFSHQQWIMGVIEWEIFHLLSMRTE